MWKQAKKQFRLDYYTLKEKGGLHRELALTCDEMHRKYTRARRGKNAIEYIGDFNFVRECRYHHPHDDKSWKSRCRKRHQWEKHYQTIYEKDVSRLLNEDQIMNEMLQTIRENAGWIKFDIRNKPDWDSVIDKLYKRNLIEWREKEIPYPYYPFCYPVCTVRAVPEVPVVQEDPEAFALHFRSADRYRHHTGKGRTRASCAPGRQTASQKKRARQKARNARHKLSPLADSHLTEFHRSLPARLQRKWQYRQWEHVISLQEKETVKTYITLLNSALRSGLKIMFKPYDSKNNPYAHLFWNLSYFRSSILRFDSCDEPSRIHNRERQFQDWLNRHLQFPLPAWTIGPLCSRLSDEDILLLESWASGQSPRNLFGLSKRENTLFHQLNCQIPSISFALAYCAAIAHHCPDELAIPLTNALIQQKEMDYVELLRYSRLIAEWLPRQMLDNPDIVRDLVDYFCRQENSAVPFSLKGRTLREIERRMHLWHKELRERELDNLTWPSHNLSWEQAEKGILFEEICNAKLLKQEGKKQHNCVSSYLSNCQEENCAIISMVSLDGIINVTLEVNLATKVIVQAKERCNSTPGKQATKYIRQYARAKALTLAA